MSIVCEVQPRFTDEELSAKADELLGKAPKTIEFPWLTERQLYHRRWRETTFCEAIANDPKRAYSMADLEMDLEEIVQNAGLTKEEEMFWRMSQEMNCNEIGVHSKLHPKTIMRRVRSATQKLAEYVASQNDVP